MFERFTDRARRVVVLAQEEARMLNHNYIGTEHILLGLIHEGEGIASQALVSLGVSLDAVRHQVEEIIGQGETAPAGHIPFTPRSKKVLELSLREALQLGHNYIGTEHILLGLIREGEGAAAQVLQRLGADLSRVRQQVIQLLSGYSSGAPAAAQPIRVLERLTDAALLGLVAARREARRLGLDTVEVGPLFVGLLAADEGTAGQALAEVVGSLDRLRAVLGQPKEQTEDAHPDADPLPLSDSARRVVTAAAGNAGGPIGVGHILAALVAEDAIAGLLRAAGIDVGEIRDRAKTLRGSAGQR